MSDTTRLLSSTAKTLGVTDVRAGQDVDEKTVPYMMGVAGHLATSRPSIVGMDP